MMEVITDQNPSELLLRASASLNALLSTYKTFPILFLTSGGSAFKLLSGISQTQLGSNLTVSVLDERIDTNPTVNNFAQLCETKFYEQAIQFKTNFISTEVGKDESVESFTIKFDTALKNWKKQNLNGKIIVTMGIGVDGHTAGIMPFQEDPEKFIKLFKNPMRWVAGYDAGNKNPYNLRATVTISYLTMQVDHAIVYCTGIEKKEALQKINNGTDLAEIPARVLNQMKDVKLFTDVSL